MPGQADEADEAKPIEKILHRMPVMPCPLTDRTDIATRTAQAQNRIRMAIFKTYVS